MSTKISPFGIPMTADQYADQWEINSDSFQREGYYSWMSEQLGSAVNVLEVGCGSGNGTLALVKGGRSVVVIEPNSKLADKTFRKLEDAGVSVRFSDASSVSALVSNNDTSVIIIKADIFDEQVDDLRTSLKFDAITCWLIGAEPERVAPHVSKPADSFVGPEAAEYREKIHERCCELGKYFLNPEGQVHFVDRQGLASWDQKDQARQYFAEVYSDIAGDSYVITKSDVFLKRIHSDMAADSRIQYHAVQAATASTLVFGSIKARLIHG